jgi:hypothetical protein
MTGNYRRRPNLWSFRQTLIWVFASDAVIGIDRRFTRWQTLIRMTPAADS